jgi:hypothetical protein
VATKVIGAIGLVFRHKGECSRVQRGDGWTPHISLVVDKIGTIVWINR